MILSASKALKSSNASDAPSIGIRYLFCFARWVFGNWRNLWYLRGLVLDTRHLDARREIKSGSPVQTYATGALLIILLGYCICVGPVFSAPFTLEHFFQLYFIQMQKLFKMSSFYVLLQGKNVTLKTVKKKQKHKSRGVVRVVTKTVQNDSFFNFFTPPTVPEDTKEDDVDEDLRNLLTSDFEIGHYIRWVFNLFFIYIVYQHKLYFFLPSPCYSQIKWSSAFKRQI